MSFKNPVPVNLLPDGATIELAKPFTYYIKDKKITIPEGFRCDGASIPRFFWRLIGSPLHGLYRNAAILHDFLYYVQITTRKEADIIFLEGMKILGVSWWKRTLMYWAVKIFGGRPWKRREEEREADGQL